MKQKVTAVFDIGKTNKKFFLFDRKFKEVHKEYASFDEIEDEDGHPTEDIHALQNWLKKVFHKILKSDEFSVKAINFSTYGASFVHLDENGEILPTILDKSTGKPFVRKRTLSANDVWIERVTYPWLEEYRPFPIWADTDFSTIQMMLPDENPLKQKYDEITDVNSPYYDYLMKHFSHVLNGPQSERYIDI